MPGKQPNGKSAARTAAAVAPAPRSTTSRARVSGAGNLAMQASFSVAREAEAEQFAAGGTTFEGPRGGSGVRRPVTGAHPLRGPGSALAPPLRAQLEARFDRDLSTVRIHSFPAELAELAQTRAFAYGADIAFAPGEFSPGTPAGERLLAHEIAHVLQQSGGAQGLGAVPEAIQADNGLDEAQLQAIRDWIAAESGAPEASRPTVIAAQPAKPVFVQQRMTFAPADGSQVIDAADLLDFMQVPEDERGQYSTGGMQFVRIPQFNAGGKNSFSHPVVDFDRDFALELRRHPWGRPPADFLPCQANSCHRTRQEAWDDQERAKDLAMRRKEKAEREAAWPGLHKAQHADDLDAQAKSLDEDISTSAMATADARLKLFDAALKEKSKVDSASQGKTPSYITRDMRDAWAAANRAAIVVEAMLKTGAKTVPEEVSAPIKELFVTFYETLRAAMRDSDLVYQRAEYIAARQRELFPLLQLKTERQCPTGACHQPNAPAAAAPQGAAIPHIPSMQLLAAPKRFAFTTDPDDPLAGFVPTKGGLEKNVDSYVRAANAASTEFQWSSELTDFENAVRIMDDLLLAELPKSWLTSAELQSFKYSRDLEKRQRIFQRQNPAAQKVQAIYYPKYDVERHYDEKGREEYSAKGIPWQLYLTHTPVADGAGFVKGFTWELHDITAGDKALGRSVRAKHEVDSVEAAVRGIYDEKVDKMDPPHELFKQLDDADFFPEGILYYRLPISGKFDHVTMTEPWSFSTWLEYVGLAIVILASLVFAPFSTPALVAAALGTGMMIAGKVIRYEDMKQKGILPEGEGGRLLFNISMDVLSMLTLGMGRVVSMATEAGNLVRASAAMRSWFFLRSVQYSADVIQVGVMVHDMVGQYQAIMNSKMDPEDKERALNNLTLMALFSGAMTFHQIWSGARELNEMSKLSLVVHPETGKLVATVVDQAEEVAHNTTGGRKSFLVKSSPKFTDAEGETHTHGIQSDGRITRCSDPPCDQQAKALGKTVSRLLLQVEPKGENAESLRKLLGRARQLREDALAAAQAGEKKLAKATPGLLEEAGAIESELKAIRAKVTAEGESLTRTGEAAAEARFGPDALKYPQDGKYTWRRHEDGTLSVQRLRRDVPVIEFVPGDGKGAPGTFRTVHSLFDEVLPERMREMNKTSVTSRWKVAAEVDDLTSLKRLLPDYGASRQKGWVKVNVTEENAFEFIDEPLRPGELRVFPNGGRMWRNPDNTIGSDSALLVGAKRRGFEQTAPPQEYVGSSGKSNLGVPVPADGLKRQRSHPAGAGTGFEFPNHIPNAPEYVNQQLQNEFIELFLRALKTQFPKKDFRLRTRHALVPSTRDLAWQDYGLDIVEGGKRRTMLELRLKPNYDNPSATNQVTLRSVTHNAEDLTMMRSIDMEAELKNLNEKVKLAIKNRKAR